MNERMPCSITDGEQYDDEVVRVEQDPDEAYDRARQDRIDDDVFEIRRNILKLHREIETPSEARLLRRILRIIQGKDHDDSN